MLLFFLTFMFQLYYLLVEYFSFLFRLSATNPQSPKAEVKGLVFSPAKTATFWSNTKSHEAEEQSKNSKSDQHGNHVHCPVSPHLPLSNLSLHNGEFLEPLFRFLRVKFFSLPILHRVL
ncbi:hypothetical protein JHK82_034328 [Glycine max]|nr:hypothetical protein JHK86_034396 [Glycine max]KAG5119908.1 hypothetical protein JHK82_034328 [Glycine max]KAG5140896.1 hypothetical protein JHK84_034664 [Glycine max]